MRERDPSVGWVRLLVLAQDSTGRDISAEEVREAVERTFGPGDELGTPWQVEPLFPGTGDPSLRRWWTVGGAIPAVQAYDTSRVAYDLASRLAAELDTDVEPDIPSTAYGIEPAEDEASEFEAIGDTRGTHLPGSDNERWAVDAVQAAVAWEIPPAPGGKARGEGVLVGSIDTGYTDHHELTGAWSFDLDWDVIDGDEDARDPLQRRWYMPLDSPGHGTHTASVVASREEGTVLGVAPLATVVPIRAVKSVVQVLDGNVARAVHEAHRRGCHVITMSLGGRGFFGLREALRAAVADGVIVMAAAGNKVGIVVAPAVYPECIAVAATNADSEPWTGSSRGSMVDIAAPGESVWVASVDSTVEPPAFLARRHHGTSFAVATLAGVAALWVGHHGHETIAEAVGGPGNVQSAFLSLLRSHGRVPPGWLDQGWDRLYGAGIVDAAALLRAPLPEVTELPPLEAPEAFDPVARLRAVLADLDRDQVRSAIGELLAIRPERVDALPPGTVSELVFRLGEDDTLRSDLVTSFAGGEAELPVRPPDLARGLLSRTSSRALREGVAEVQAGAGD